MINEDIWSALELDEEEVRRREEFYESYEDASARFLEIDPAAYDGSDGSESGLIPFSDDPPGGTGESGEPDGPEPIWAAKEPWASQAERADALREAAIAALLIDSDRGQALLARSSDLYADSAPTYSMFLGGVARPQALPELSMEAGRIVADGFPSAGNTSMATADGSAARLLHALLLVGGSSEAPAEFSGTIGRAAESIAIHSPVPFGTAGSPLADWWVLALRLCAPREQPDQRQLIPRLEKLARAHGDQLAAAQLDRYHWSRLYGRVDLVDLDLACAVALANRRLAAEERAPIELESFSDELPKLARVSLAVGINLGEMGIGPGTEPSGGNPLPGPEGTEPPSSGPRDQLWIRVPAQAQVATAG